MFFSPVSHSKKKNVDFDFSGCISRTKLSTSGNVCCGVGCPPCDFHRCRRRRGRSPATTPNVLFFGPSDCTSISSLSRFTSTVSTIVYDCFATFCKLFTKFFQTLDLQTMPRRVAKKWFSSHFNVAGSMMRPKSSASTRQSTPFSSSSPFIAAVMIAEI